ncbi:hypothetical protein GGE16_004752 [Rhizobium leguminosarum]|uniref:Uncharacterized protein n=1 Tax=Rhizobium leguminosarum TaxID=384 RepID=A0AAE2MNI5_RHILE|nr:MULTISPECIES: hypothetical protein [Rhizobium]MBB4292673.1 hypothetical protein [Rhizobium leguminosarum]MBB4298911.1 hypothetical protein [Rhizobium leguminosarum]MBB4310116.1 hypothetical protein [Rhizobium leguminosarum]MBB4434378.1 hypothetical protein [Rhizobium esperanzae]MBB4531274.1 hypothetical protein [Rhizobium leguminosarum]
MLGLFRKSEPETKAHDWYHAATPEDRQEYDAFGPWVYQITKESEMPSRFRFAYARHHDARFILKIPVHADRRVMRPGMDLYLAVLAIDENGVSIYRLVENRIVFDECSWDGVAAVRNGSDLLQGTFSLLLTSGSEIKLAFNNVSKRLMEDASDFVRSRCASPVQTPRLPATVPSIAITDNFFRSMFLIAQGRCPTPIAAAHFEPPGSRCLDRDGRRRMTTGLLLLLAPDELIIISRDQPTRRYLQDSYSALTTCVPLARIAGYDFREATTGGTRPRFHELLLRLGAQDLLLFCLAVPETVLARLDDLAIPRIGSKTL